MVTESEHSTGLGALEVPMDRGRATPRLSRLERAAGLNRRVHSEASVIQEREKEIQSAFDTFNVQGVAEFQCFLCFCI